jgi:hypothetical protein
MEGLAASVVVIAILLGVLLVVVFDVLCLLYLGKADTAHFLLKFVWAVLIVCTSPIGGLVYLLAQRLPKRSPEPPDRAHVGTLKGLCEQLYGAGRFRRAPDEVISRGLSRSLPDNTAGIATWLDARQPNRRGRHGIGQIRGWPLNCDVLPLNVKGASHFLRKWPSAPWH